MRALETRLGVFFPKDFATYLLTACATVDDGGEMDSAYNAWWGLDHIKTVSAEYGHDLQSSVLTDEASTAVIFADHAVWCMAWAICCGAGPNYGKVFVINDPARFVADDFAMFVTEYVRQPHSLL